MFYLNKAQCYLILDWSLSAVCLSEPLSLLRNWREVGGLRRCRCSTLAPEERRSEVGSCVSVLPIRVGYGWIERCSGSLLLLFCHLQIKGRCIIRSYSATPEVRGHAGAEQPWLLVCSVDAPSRHQGTAGPRQGYLHLLGSDCSSTSERCRKRETELVGYGCKHRSNSKQSLSLLNYWVSLVLCAER